MIGTGMFFGLVSGHIKRVPGLEVVGVERRSWTGEVVARLRHPELEQMELRVSVRPGPDADAALHFLGELEDFIDTEILPLLNDPLRIMQRAQLGPDPTHHPRLA